MSAWLIHLNKWVSIQNSNSNSKISNLIQEIKPKYVLSQIEKETMSYFKNKTPTIKMSK